MSYPNSPRGWIFEKQGEGAFPADSEDKEGSQPPNFDSNSNNEQYSAKSRSSKAKKESLRQEHLKVSQILNRDLNQQKRSILETVAGCQLESEENDSSNSEGQHRQNQPQVVVTSPRLDEEEYSFGKAELLMPAQRQLGNLGITGSNPKSGTKGERWDESFQDEDRKEQDLELSYQCLTKEEFNIDVPQIHLNREEEENPVTLANIKGLLSQLDNRLSHQNTKSTFLNVPDPNNIILNNYNRQSTFNSKNSSSFQKSDANSDSDSSFHSISTDILNAINSEYPELLKDEKLSKKALGLRSQGTFNFKQENDSNPQNEPSSGCQVLPFGRSLTSRTKYSQQQQQLALQRSSTLGKESFITDEQDDEGNSIKNEIGGEVQEGSLGTDNVGGQWSLGAKGASLGAGESYRIQVNAADDESGSTKEEEKNHLIAMQLKSQNNSFCENSPSFYPQHRLQSPIKQQLTNFADNSPSFSQYPESQFLLPQGYQSSGLPSPSNNYFFLDNNQSPTKLPNQIYPFPSFPTNSNNFLQAPKVFQGQGTVDSEQEFERKCSLSNNSSNSNKSLGLIQAYQRVQTKEEKKKFMLTNAHLMARDFYGNKKMQSKIQKWLKKGDLSFCESLILKVLPVYADLMMDAYGNYLCQKLVQLPLFKKYQTDVLLQVKKDFSKIALNKHGTRALQFLLNEISPLSAEDSKIISEAIQHDLVKVSTNIHGNHVIQICLAILISDEDKVHIYKMVIDNFLLLIKDKHACCVVQKCLELGPKKVQEDIVDLVIQNIGQLINDQFGNYVVQQVVKRQIPVYNKLITDYVCTNIEFFCTQKISSNVMESIIQFSNKAHKECIIKQLLFDKAILKNIMVDQFGNYVIQQVFQIAKSDFAKENYYEQLYSIFEENFEELQIDLVGKKFITKIKKIKEPSYSKSNSSHGKRGNHRSKYVSFGGK